MKHFTLLKTLTIAFFLLAGVGSTWGQIISQYVETNSGSTPKGIEIWNNSLSILDFSTNNLIIQQGSSGGALADLPGTLINTGTLAPNDVLVIGSNDIGPYLTNHGITSIIYVSFGFNFNGDDAIAVKYGGTITDVFGTPGIDPGAAWAENGVSTANQNISLLNYIVDGDLDGWTNPSERFETFSSNPSGTGGLVGFGIPPNTPGFWKPNTTTSQWTTGANWDDGNEPQSSTNVIIPTGAANYPTISSPAACNNIKIEVGATLLGGENLTVNGTAFVEKSISGYTTDDDGWHVISTPVSGMNMAGSNLEPVVGEDDIFAYDQAEALWRNYYDNENPASWFDEFDPGTGYLVAYAPTNAGTKLFAGALNTDASYVLSPSNSNTAWTLIGNPYPSKVTWADVNITNISSPKSMNATTGAWENLGTELEVGQGIFVYAESGSASLTFEHGDQTHGAAKKADDNSNRMKLLATSGIISVNLEIEVNENASRDYDWKYDSRYLYPFTSIPYLFAYTKDDISVSRYAFASEMETTIVQLYFKVPEPQEITFKIENIIKDGNFKKLTIEDSFTNEFTVLSDGQQYTFMASPNDVVNRFKLHAETTTGIHESSEISGLNIYTHANTLYLNSDKARNAVVEMYNVTGQKVFGKNVTLDGLTQINPQLTTGWYVVKVTSTEGMATEKVFIK